MLRQSMSFLKSLVLGTSLALALVGCASDPDAPGPTDQGEQVQNELVSARDLAAVPDGERLRVDLVDDVVYFFDYSAPLDYARVEVAVGDVTFSLEDHILNLQSFDYNPNPPIDLTESPDNQFRMAADPADLGGLTESEIAVLKENGYFYKELSKPGVAPQTTGDNCIQAICETCGPPPGATFCDWSPANPCVCTYETHEWCD